MISREDTRRDRVRAARDKRERISAAAVAWRSAREYKKVERAGGEATVRTAGPVQIIVLPVIRHGVEFWVIAAWAGGHAVEFYSRMGEIAALQLAERIERKYHAEGELISDLEMVLNSVNTISAGSLVTEY